MTATVTFSTREYQMAWGTKPRGYGHWAMNATIQGRPGSYTTETYWNTGTLTEAKRLTRLQARADFPNALSIEIEVGS